MSRTGRDITGERFGKLVVTGFAGYGQAGRQRVALWECRCDCGHTRRAEGYVLKSGKNQNPRYVNIPSDGIIQITKPKLCREGGCEEACLFYEDFFFDKNVG